MNQNRNLLQGIRQMIRLEQTPWDGYAAEMADADVLASRGEELAVKSFFLRQPPFGGSFTYIFGITAFLRTVSEIRFDSPEFAEAMLERGRSQEFVDFMRQHKQLKVRIYAPTEGKIFGPNEPIITVMGYLPHVRLIEGMMNILNSGSLLFTKWRRCVLAAAPEPLSAFERRRAQNPDLSTLAALCAGVFGSSNEELLRYFKFVLVATMGHEWMQSFRTIEEAYDVWLTYKPHKPIGLVDTHKVLEHDFPAWLDAVYKHRDVIKAANPAVWGWRNDSGDLAYLPEKQWQMFMRHPLSKDPWFVERARIFQTNDLDEYTMTDIKTEIRQTAADFGIYAEELIPRFSWAAGTKPGTAYDQPSLGGVAKLQQWRDNACIKLAFNALGEPGIKTSIPGFNLSAQILDQTGKLICIYIYPASLYLTFENGPLIDARTLKPIETLIACHPSNPGASMEITNYQAWPQQTIAYDSLTYYDIINPLFADFTIDQVTHQASVQESHLDRSHLRFVKPHTIKVSVAPELFDLRTQMITDGTLVTGALSEINF